MWTSKAEESDARGSHSPDKETGPGAQDTEGYYTGFHGGEGSEKQGPVYKASS